MWGLQGSGGPHGGLGSLGGGGGGHDGSGDEPPFAAGFSRGSPAFAEVYGRSGAELPGVAAGLVGVAGLGGPAGAGGADDEVSGRLEVSGLDSSAEELDEFVQSLHDSSRLSVFDMDEVGLAAAAGPAKKRAAAALPRLRAFEATLGAGPRLTAI